MGDDCFKMRRQEWLDKLNEKKSAAERAQHVFRLLKRSLEQDTFSQDLKLGKCATVQVTSVLELLKCMSETSCMSRWQSILHSSVNTFCQVAF